MEFSIKFDTINQDGPLYTEGLKMRNTNFPSYLSKTVECKRPLFR